MDYDNDTTLNITDSIHELKTFLPYWADVLYYMILWPITIIGFIGNCMVIFAVAFSQRLHTSTNVFVTSLAVSDLLICFAVCLGSLAHFLPQTHWTVNKICQFAGFATYSCVGTSLYTLGAIGVNRLILITKRNLYRKIFTSWKLGICVATIWLVPTGTFFIALINGIGAVGFDHVYQECGLVHTHERAADLDLIMFAVGIPIPFVAIIVSYTWIYLHIKKHFKIQEQHLKNLPTTSIVGSRSSNELSRTRENSSNDEEINVHPRMQEVRMHQLQITKNLFLIVCAFLICFFTPSITLLIGKSSPMVENIVWFVELLALANSTINFVIYASKHPDFKIVLGHMMRCSYSKIPQPSKVLKFVLSMKSYNHGKK